MSCSIHQLEFAVPSAGKQIFKVFQELDKLLYKEFILLVTKITFCPACSPPAPRTVPSLLRGATKAYIPATSLSQSLPPIPVCPSPHTHTHHSLTTQSPHPHACTHTRKHTHTQSPPPPSCSAPLPWRPPSPRLPGHPRRVPPPPGCLTRPPPHRPCQGWWWGPGWHWPHQKEGPGWGG
jgi:hypothetical protein